MIRLFATAIASWMLLTCGPMSHKAQSQSGGTEVVPRCPSIEEQQAAAGSKRRDGTEDAPVMPVERSVILPSAGEPPAQAGEGKFRTGVDCPMAPTHPNAIKPDDKMKP